MAGRVSVELVGRFAADRLEGAYIDRMDEGDGREKVDEKAEAVNAREGCGQGRGVVLTVRTMFGSLGSCTET
jgi:hypothetical protein